jgi:two-component system LytT family response regulator
VVNDDRFRVLIADDLPLSRARLEDLLAPEEDFAVVGCARDGDEALRMIGTLKPDLVFLDIHLPRRDGFRVAQSLARDSAPAIIFVTGDSTRALTAFDLRALDYLLKPVSAVRFAETLVRARAALRGSLHGLTRRFARAVSEAALATPREQMLVKRGGHIYFVPFAAIEHIEARANYVKLHVETGEHVVRGTIAEIARALDAHRFCRVHRSHIVNVDRIKEIRPRALREHTIVLQSGTQVPLSETYQEQLDAHLALYDSRGPARAIN